MTPLTAKALSDQEEFYARVRPCLPTNFFLLVPISVIISLLSFSFYVTTRLGTRILDLRSDKGQQQQERVTIAQSHAAKVIQEEQIQKYFSQRGIAEGHDIMAGEAVRVSRLGGHGHASTHGSGGGIMSRDTAIQRDSGMRDNNDDSWNSLKMFMPRQPPTRGHEQLYEASGATPLERLLTPGASSDPSYIRKPAIMQAQCYGDMGSVEGRAHQAQVLADKTIRDGQARKESTCDGFVYE